LNYLSLLEDLFIIQVLYAATAGALFLTCTVPVLAERNGIQGLSVPGNSHQQVKSL